MPRRLCTAPTGGRTASTPVHSSAMVRDFPLGIEGQLEEPLSRWMWLVKWLPLIPHYVADGHNLS
jgi:hypothetical protein